MAKPKKESTLNQSIWPYLAPQYWITWFGVGIAWLLAHIPWKLQRFLGKNIGRLLYKLSARRRNICLTNLTLCYPEMAKDERESLAKRHFESMGIGVFEMLISWFFSVEHSAPRVTFSGEALLEETFKQGKGCVIIGGHFSSLDLCGGQMTRFVKVHPIYKLQSNPVLNWIMERQRERTFEKTIERSNMREVVKSLKSNRAVWYAIDQDYGRKASVFAPFFGVNCATIAHIGKVSRITDAPVLLYDYYRTKTGYHISLQPTPEGFPFMDDTENATAMNKMMEQLINSKKEQYFWTHRRFKTQENEDDKGPY